MEYLEIIEKSMDQLVSLAHFMVSTIFKIRKHHLSNPLMLIDTVNQGNWNLSIK